MNPMIASMALGYTAEQVLNYIMKSSPKYAKAIQQSMQQGYTPEQITEFLTKEFEGKSPTKYAKRLEKNIEGRASDSQKKAIAELRGKREGRLGKIFAGAGLAAAGAYGAAKVLGQGPKGPSPTMIPFTGQGPGSTGMPLPGAQPPPGPQPMGGGSPMQGAVPGGPNWTKILKAYQQHLSKGGKLSLNSFVKTAFRSMAGDMMGQMAGGAAPQAAQPQGMQEPIDVTDEVEVMGQQQPMPQPNLQAEAGMAQQPAITEPQVQEQQIRIPKSAQSEEILSSLGILEKISELKEKGKSPELIALASNKFLSPEAKQIVQSNDINVPAAVWEFMTRDSETLAKQQESKASVEPEQGEPLQVPSVGKTAMLPNGAIGKVTEVGDKTTRLESDGKKLKAPNDQVWVPSDEIQIYAETDLDKFVDQIPEKERSTAFYNFQKLPNDMVMAEMTSDPTHVYFYSNVPEHLSDRILSASTNPKTSGGNLFGIYRKEVADSRGSPFDEIKSNPSKYPFIKVKKGYDLFQRLKQELTSKDKKLKKEERKKKREEKSRQPRR